MDIPSMKQFADIVERARVAGVEAAAKESHQRGGGVGFCGGGYLLLAIPPRSPLGDLLQRASGRVANFRLLPGGGRSTVAAAILGMTSTQDQSVRVAAEEAALAILKEALAVEGWVYVYDD